MALADGRGAVIVQGVAAEAEEVLEQALDGPGGAVGGSAASACSSAARASGCQPTSRAS
ncbi:MAG: hypothetical protein U0802_18035 [Candidatus Binatia bacterium]